MSYQTVEHSDYAMGGRPPVSASTGYGWIAFVIIIFVIIILIVLGIFFFERGDTVSSVSHTWVIQDNSSTGAVNYTATGGNLLVNKSSGNVVLSLTAPADPTGQQFIVDNSRGGGTVTIGSGVTVSPTITYNGSSSTTSSNVIVRGKVGSFVWETATSLIRLY